MNRTSIRRLVRAASAESDRAMREMRIAGHPRPYYISYLVRDEESWRLEAKYGSLQHSTRERRRNALADVRVGSFRQDQVREGGLEDNDKEAESYGYVDLPFGDEGDGLRHGLWRLTDARYREAVEMLLHKRSHALTYLDENRHLPAFQRREPVVDLDWRSLPDVDEEYWTGYVKSASRSCKRYTDISDSHVEFRADHACHVFVNSEGSRLVQCRPIWSLECYLWLLSPAGDSFPWTVHHTVSDPGELPDLRRFRAEIDRAVETVRRLSRAPSIQSFCGPALLEPVPAGLLMHEALGHRLEGSRLLAAGEGRTFKDSVGDEILPAFLSLRDDPTMGSFQGRSLVGHYAYDDEGVAAQDTELIRKGRLTGFLTGRTGTMRRQGPSNGHARSNYHQRAISRMGVLCVDSENGLERRALRKRFLEEIRRQKVPFGIRVVEATSGETATDAYNFQAFLGEVNLATRVYPDGREEWIRGVNFVGTPLNAIRGILASGDVYEVDNAYCGAESGYLPVSTISPALLVSELELQSKPDSPYTQYTFSMPWTDSPAGRRRTKRRGS